MHDEQLIGEWLVITIIAFVGGLVSNIVEPKRRGIGGFFHAALVGIFCGGVAGISAHAFDAPAGYQYMISAIAGVLGDRMLSAVFFQTSPKVVNVHTEIHGHNQQNINQEGGDVRQDL